MEEVIWRGARQQLHRKRHARALCPVDRAKSAAKLSNGYLDKRAERRHPARGGAGWFVLQPDDSPHHFDLEFEVEFNLLVEQWLEETRLTSSLTKIIMNRAYQRIIGLGPQAVPYILRELRDRPAPWFWALWAITGEDPAAGIYEFDQAARAWLTWGAHQGQL
jgi:hypothetical protein